MAGAKEQFRLTLRWIAPLGLLFAVSFFSLPQSRKSKDQRLFVRVDDMKPRNQAYQHSSAAFLQFCKQGNVALLFFMPLGALHDGLRTSATRIGEGPAPAAGKSSAGARSRC